MGLIKLISDTFDSIDFDVTLQEILDSMIKNQAKHFVLLKDRKPIGIITEKDILNLYTKHIDLNQKAINFANTKLITTRRSRKTDYVLGLMLNNKVRRIIVVDSENNYLGSILQEKLIYEFEQDIFKTNITAKDLIKDSEKALKIQSKCSIQNALDLMTQNDSSFILVFKDNAPIGILTEGDVINLAQKHIDTNLNIEQFCKKEIISFKSEDSLFDIVQCMKEINIKKAIIFDKTENDYFVITSKEILNNVKGNYNLLLESKLKDIKNTFNSLNEAVIELFDNDEEQIIYWFNQKAASIFDLKVDANITSILPPIKWQNIYKKLKSKKLFENEIIEIGENIFQLTILDTKVLDNSIIKLIFTNVSEISKTNEQIENNFRFLYEEVPYAYQSLNHFAEITNVNKKWLEITGYEKDEVIGEKFYDFLDENKNYYEDLFCKFLKTKHIENARLKIKKKDNSIIIASFTGNSTCINGEIHTHCIFKDITEEEKIQKKLQLSDIVFENTTEGIIITDNESKIISVNSAFSKITGYFFEEIKNKTPNILKSGKQDNTFYKNLWTELIEKDSWKGEIWNRKKNGEIYPEWLNISTVRDAKGKILNYVAIFSDISKIKKSNEKIEFLAHHDPLTGLPNRLLLKARLNKSIEIAKKENKKLALIFIDIDNFKLINDTYGHSIGDNIINLVASRLQNSIRKDDTISRIGGDEFILVIEDIIELNHIKKIAQNILDNFNKPIKMQEYLFDVTLSMGISIYPHDGYNDEDLIKHADTAMYSAKNLGKNQFQFYKNEMTNEIFEKLMMKQELNEAINNSQFEVYYQPQIDLKTNKIVGAEALIRWNHRNLGLVYPDDFITFAEDSKQIIQIGKFVLQKACNFIKKLHTTKILENGVIAVNISNIQIKCDDVLELIKNELKNSNLEAKFLEIELSENYVMDDVEESLSILNNLKTLGVKLAIDDFGTGYSSLNYLKQFPIDKLKIDRSFVKDFTIDSKDTAIVKALIALGNGLGIKTIAEGVEKEIQKELLIQEGCDEIQGWIYSKALKEDDFINFVKNFN